MKTPTTNVILLLSCIAANTLPRWYLNGGTVAEGTLFCKWQAASFVLMALAAVNRQRSQKEKELWYYTISIAWYNLMDELFGVAERFPQSEKIYAIVVTLWTIYRLTRCRSKITSPKP
jgi:hypothetical protein